MPRTISTTHDSAVQLPIVRRHRYDAAHHVLFGILAAWLVLIQLPGKALADDNDLKGRFLREAVQAWRAYEKAMRDFNGTIDVIIKQKGFDFTSKKHTAFQSNGKCMVVIVSDQMRSSEGERYTCRSYGQNQKYAFTLWRETPDSAWILANVQLLKDEAPDPKVERRFQLTWAAVTSLIDVYNMQLPDLITHDRFVLVSCDSTTIDGLKLARIEFRIARDSGKQPRKVGLLSIVRRGTLVVDPAHHWCLRSSKLELDGLGIKGNETMELTDWSEEDGLLVPREIVARDTMTVTHKGKSVDVRRLGKARYDLYRPKAPPPDSEFRLIAFGLPEPPGVEWEEPIPPVYWAIAIGIGLIVVGVGVFGYFRRRAAKAA